MVHSTNAVSERIEVRKDGYYNRRCRGRSNRRCRGPSNRRCRGRSNRRCDNVEEEASVEEEEIVVVQDEESLLLLLFFLWCSGNTHSEKFPSVRTEKFSSGRKFCVRKISARPKFFRPSDRPKIFRASTAVRRLSDGRPTHFA